MNVIPIDLGHRKPPRRYGIPSAAGILNLCEARAITKIVAAKRDHHSLTDPQIDWVIDAYTRGAVADEQDNNNKEK